MLDLHVIDQPATASVALDPVRNRLLSELTEPASAATLATRMGIARQKVNYHLRTLEACGLVTVASSRRWGGLTERLMVATAASYVISPSALGPIGADPARSEDRLSASYVVALAARLVREVSGLLRRARESGQRLATFSLDSEIRFRSAQERAAFTRELTASIADLVSRYHHADTPGARRHRLVIAAHPLPQERKRHAGQEG